MLGTSPGDLLLDLGILTQALGVRAIMDLAEARKAVRAADLAISSHRDAVEQLSGDAWHALYDPAKGPFEAVIQSISDEAEAAEQRLRESAPEPEATLKDRIDAVRLEVYARRRDEGEAAQAALESLKNKAVWAAECVRRELDDPSLEKDLEAAKLWETRAREEIDRLTAA